MAPMETSPKLEASEKLELHPRRPRSMSIVLTGGPCSGKSSILALIRDRLSKRGMQVITVPEYATHFFANSDGFQPAWVGAQEEQNLQDIFLRYQVTQENMFHEYAALNTKPSVLLLDRAVLDQKVFTSSEEIWQSALDKNNVTEEQLLSRYDMVMHLGTCAKAGDYQWGPGSNNPGRYHTPDEAAALDKKCEEVYHNHKQLRMVPHCGKFEDKVEQVLKYLEDALDVDGLAGKRQRVSVRAKTFPADVMQASHAFQVTSKYLDSSMQLSVRRRQRMHVEQWRACFERLDGSASGPTASSEEHATFEERRSIPDEDLLARRVIPESVYHTAMQLAAGATIDKYVLSFQVSAGLHYELFYFRGDSGSSALVLDFPVGADMPEWLECEATAEVRPHPTSQQKLLPSAGSGGSSGRRPRVLKKNSTEDAAAEYLVHHRRNVVEKVVAEYSVQRSTTVAF